MSLKRQKVNTTLVSSFVAFQTIGSQVKQVNEIRILDENLDCENLDCENHDREGEPRLGEPQLQDPHHQLLPRDEP